VCTAAASVAATAAAAFKMNAKRLLLHGAGSSYV
jgi:hypothetical protein